MDNPYFATLSDPRAVVADKNGELWLPLTESPDLSNRTETVEVAGVWFDVLGYSEERDALLLEPIKIEGSAENIDHELGDYLAHGE